MKKMVFTLLGIACLLSCEIDPLKKEGCLSSEDTASVQFSVLDSGGGTKRAAIQENAINSIQMLVFSAENGSRIAYSRDVSNGEVNLDLPKGREMSCYALVNVSEDLSSVVSETDLLGKKAYFKDNSLSGFEMIGHYKGWIRTDTLVCIPVERFVAKIRVAGINYRMNCGYTQIESFSGCRPTFEAVYLLNTADECAYDFEGESSHYTSKYNSGSKTKNQYEMTYTLGRIGTEYSQIWDGNEWVRLKDMEVYKRISEGYKIWTFYPDDLLLYCFPNHSEPYTSKNRSQLVVDFSGTYRDVSTNVVRAHHHYFTFTLPVLEHNMMYDLGMIQIEAEGEDSPGQGSYDYPLSVKLDCNIDIVDLSSGEIRETIPFRRKLYELETY